MNLISFVRIDAFHSFQDIILPVVGGKSPLSGIGSALLGGVDMDKLSNPA